MERTKDLINSLLTKESIFTVFITGIFLHVLPVIRDYIYILNPVILIFFAVFSLYSSFKFNSSVYLLIIGLYLFTFISEVIGVRTGLIFGSYIYEGGLVPQLFGVPVVIGLLWLSLIFGGYYILTELKIGKYMILILNPIIITFFDYIIEPVAIKLNYWEWANVSIPTQNYIAWYIISLIVTVLIVIFKVEIKDNQAIKHFFYAQLFFFLVLDVLFKVLPL